MQRVLFASLALTIGGLWVALADDPKDAPASPLAQKVAKLRKKFDEDEKALKKKLADAKDGEDQRQISFQIKELSAITASDALDLADEGKKDEGGLDAAVFALKLLGQHRITGADMDKAATIILDNHIESPKIAPALALMVDNERTGMTFLQTVAEKATNPEVQGLALFYTAMALDAKAGGQESNGNAEAATRTRNEAADMMAKALKLAPDAKVGSGTLAKAVEAEMVSLKIGVGNPVPDVDGIDLDGKKVKLSSYRGKVVLFDFWATWCGPCVAMIPHERELVEKQAGKPFALLSVNVDEDKGQLSEFLGKEKMPWSHWFDGPRGPVAKMFKVRAYPTLYLIDTKGIVRKKWIGSPGNDVIDKAVEELVAEAQSAKR
jgi:thiol-disulfide isomerase/thioredoxin